MKRTISFPEGQSKNQQRFELLFGALLMGHRPAQGEQRGIEIIRREARIMDTLETASDTTDDPKISSVIPGESARVVRPGASFELEQADFTLLAKRLETTEWVPVVARKIVDCVDWFSSAPEVAAEKEKK